MHPAWGAGRRAKRDDMSKKVSNNKIIIVSMKDNSKARNSPDQLCTRKAPPQKDGEELGREKGSYLEGRSSVFSWMLILFLC